MLSGKSRLKHRSEQSIFNCHTGTVRTKMSFITWTQAPGTRAVIALRVDPRPSVQFFFSVFTLPVSMFTPGHLLLTLARMTQNMKPKRDPNPEARPVTTEVPCCEKRDDLDDVDALEKLSAAYWPL